MCTNKCLYSSVEVIGGIGEVAMPSIMAVLSGGHKAQQVSALKVKVNALLHYLIHIVRQISVIT
jgi:hypothetical protein